MHPEQREKEADPLPPDPSEIERLRLGILQVAFPDSHGTLSHDQGATTQRDECLASYCYR